MREQENSSVLDSYLHPAKPNVTRKTTPKKTTDPHEVGVGGGGEARETLVGFTKLACRCIYTYGENVNL